MIRSVIQGTGAYLPTLIWTNDDLARRGIETSDEWIRTRTGITQRHIAAEGETTADMAAAAARNALQHAGVQAGAVDMIIVATTTPDNTFPSTAAKVQAALGNTSAAAFDVQAVCAGFIYALSLAHNCIRGGQARTVLVIGADKMTSLIDWEDRNTCILFGDGAGAVLLQAEEGAGNRGVLDSCLHSDGSTRDLLYVDGGVSSNGQVGKMHMLGQEVFKHAVQKMADATQSLLARQSLTGEVIDWVIPHQANQRIIDATAKRLGASPDKVISTVGQHANTSAASIPLALDVAVKDGRVKQGHLLAMQAIGGGLAWGAALVRF